MGLSGQRVSQRKRELFTAFCCGPEIDEMPEDQKKPIEVIPGMVATAEIITGERTVAQYLLKPLRRVGSEALVER